MINFKKETLQTIINTHHNIYDIEWAIINIDEDIDAQYDETEEPIKVGRIVLKEKYVEDELLCFLNLFDFEYDNGFGLQYINGIIKFKDNSWLERVEYDGAETWGFHYTPNIPTICKRN